MNLPAMLPDLWRDRIREACDLYQFGQLSNRDAMLLAVCLAAYPAADWPTPRLPIVDAIADLDPSTTPGVEYCESMLGLAESAAFDAVVVMFDLVRAYDRATPVDRESGAFGGL